ncbi:VWA domain-containing protein [Hazenella sp. IB182353]|uniref:VWA domain-containing protein n=1 Tax=Polycladospora coralii TaxID=2771432 RepID=UPI0017469DDC|nr:VWA domain-containing protein [Polycladospora coralii]MBS7531556.1 VWA domain-containing protein [Polycladospora coralii]
MRLLNVLFIFSLIFLSGCSSLVNQLEGLKQEQEEKQTKNDTTNKEENKGTEKKEERPENYLMPEKKNLKWFLREPAGTYAGKKFDKQKVIAELSKTSLDAKEEDNYKNIIQLVGQDYTVYADFIDQFDATAPVHTKVPTISRTSGKIVPGKMNVEILLDASGSMNEKIDGKTKMELAKQSIQQFLSQMPDNIHASLRIYGNKGSNRDADKQVSCESTEVIYPLSKYNESNFKTALSSVNPVGWTPLAKAIEQAKVDLASQTDAENIVYVVSDGIETCGGDPVKAASSLHYSDIGAIVNIIGFDIDDAGQTALKKVAKAGEGSYSTVESKEQLEDYFQSEKDKLNHAWDFWYEYNYDKVDNWYDTEYEKVDNAYDEMWQMADDEYDLMYEVCDETPGCGREVKSWLYDRSKLIKSYAYDHTSAFKSELYDATSAAKSKYYDMKKEAKKKINN